MRVRGVLRLVAGHRGGTVRWRRAAVLTMAAVLPVTATTAAAAPASAAGGYAVTATITVGPNPTAVAVDPATHTAYVTNPNDDTVSVISPAGDPRPGPGPRFRPPAISSANHATFRHGRHGSFTVRAGGIPAAAVAEAGKLPHGVSFTATANGTAAIAGTPATSARGKTYVITLTARNGAGKSATQRFTLKVS